MSLASDGSISDIYETCKTCDKNFENELDLANHEKRLHEYGETFEKCGFRGTDLVAIKSHVVEVHRGESNATLSILSDVSDMVESSLEEANPAVSILSDVSEIEENYLEGLGIEKLPVITQRRKQNLKDLNIYILDANGDIILEDDTDDEDFDSQEELLLLEEDDWVQPIKPIATRRTRATVIQPMVEEILEKGRKRKADEKVQAPKRQNTAPNSLQCNICDVNFSRKDN
jgi:hypothetical protein